MPYDAAWLEARSEGSWSDDYMVNATASLGPIEAFAHLQRTDEGITMVLQPNDVVTSVAPGDLLRLSFDDDRMGEWRLSYQVGELLQQPTMTLCGLSRLLYYEPGSDRAWEYVYPKSRTPWVCGGSFCYRKEFWKKYPFPARNEGADTMWVWGLRGQKIVAHGDHSFYVGIIHSANTSFTKDNGCALAEEFFANNSGLDAGRLGFLCQSSFLT